MIYAIKHRPVWKSRFCMTSVMYVEVTVLVTEANLRETVVSYLLSTGGSN
jgi:hypothetical protein